jgi:hypothetical protein
LSAYAKYTASGVPYPCIAHAAHTIRPFSAKGFSAHSRGSYGGLTGLRSASNLAGSFTRRCGAVVVGMDAIVGLSAASVSEPARDEVLADLAAWIERRPCQRQR